MTPRRRNPRQGDLFTSKFEDDFLLRTLGDIVRVPDTALSELVANAWDAGAARVHVTIPEASGETLSVEDDGCGLTKAQFEERWMRLAYNRQKHQGSDAEFPPGREGRRRAYGRNGQGRHGLLCFADEYVVETTRDGRLHRFRVNTASGNGAFESHLVASEDRTGHGTKLLVQVERHRPDPDRIREELASRFLFDPQFLVSVNRVSLPLAELPGVESDRIEVEDVATKRQIVLHLYVVQADAGRTKRQSGVAFWVGGRLVGQPGWTVLGTPTIDGRTRPGRRTTVVVSSDDLFDEVLPDWTGFRRSDLMSRVAQAVVAAVEKLLTKVYAQRINDTTREVLEANYDRLTTLDPGDARDVVDVARVIATKHPLIVQEALSAAVEGIIEAKRDASAASLVSRILALPEEDQAGLARLLDEWTVRDAMTVLDEIGRRIKVVEAIEKLMGDPNVDELHVLHPLVAQARWLFGPEYDSPHYSFNVGLRKAVEAVFKVKVDGSTFANPRRRPDLIVRPTETIAAVASENCDPDTGMVTLRRILLVELKKGGSTIGRDDMTQAANYVEDLVHCDHVTGTPYVHAFVVGNGVDRLTTLTRKVGEAPERGRVDGVDYAGLVATANARLFRIREQVSDRYPDSAQSLLQYLKSHGTEALQLGLQLGDPVPPIPPGDARPPDAAPGSP